MRVVVADNYQIYLGRQGENGVTQVRFPFVAEWEALYGAGTFEVQTRRPGEAVAWTVQNTRIVGDSVVWDVTATDTAFAGTGYCQLRYTVGSALAKSSTWATKITESLSGTSADPPEAWQSWVDQVLQTGAIASEASQAAVTAAAGAAASEAIAVAAGSDAEAWAVGKRGGTDVLPNDVTHNNNAKHYAGEAATSAGAASGSANAAYISETAAAGSALDAQKWTTGAGTSGDGGGTTPGAKNNAAYWAGQAADSAGAAADSATAADESADAAADSAAAAAAMTGAPAGYARLRYLQSDGAVCINTEIKMNQDSRVVCRFAAVEEMAYGTNRSGYVFGARKSTSSMQFCFGQYPKQAANGKDRWLAAYDTTSSGGTVDPDVFPFDTAWHTVDYNANVVQIDGTTVKSFSQSSGFECNANLRLFALIQYASSTDYYYGKFRISEVWIYQDGTTLAQHYIPVRRESDDELGLYDLVNDVFRTKAGNGSFVSGGEVSVTDIYENIAETAAGLADAQSDTAVLREETDKAIAATYPTLAASGETAVVENGAQNVPLVSLKATIVARQAAGTPTEEDPIEITGYTGMTVIVSGKNLLGGNMLRDEILAAEPNVADSADSRYVRLAESKSASGTLFATGLYKPNTTYTIKIGFKVASSSYKGSYMRLVYTDGTYEAFDSGSTTGVIYTKVIVSDPTKTVAGLQLVPDTTRRQYYYYDYFGIYEGEQSSRPGFVGSSFKKLTFGETVWGGEYDARTGILTVTHAETDNYDGVTALPGKWISSMDEYAAGTTPTAGAQVVWELAEADYTTIELEPADLRSVAGDNYITCTAGPVEAEIRVRAIGRDAVKVTPREKDMPISGFTVNRNPYISAGKIDYGTGQTRAGSAEFKIPEEYDYLILECARGYSCNLHEIYADDGSARTVTSWNRPAIIVKVNHDARYVVQGAMRNINSNVTLPEDGILCTLHLYKELPMPQFAPIHDVDKTPQADVIYDVLWNSVSKQPQALGFGGGKLLVCTPGKAGSWSGKFEVIDPVTGTLERTVTFTAGTYGHMNDVAYREGYWYIPYYNADGVAQDKCFVFDSTLENPTEMPLLDENGEAFACWRFAYNKLTDEFIAAAHTDYTFLVYDAADLTYKRTITLSGSTTITGGDDTKTLMQGMDTDGTYLYICNVSNNFATSYVTVHRLEDGKLIGAMDIHIPPHELEGWAYDWDHELFYQFYYAKPDGSHRGYTIHRINPYSQPNVPKMLRSLMNDFNIGFEFTSTPGFASVDKSLTAVQAAHEAGRRVWLSGDMDGAVVHVEVTGFVYSGGDLTAWVAVTTAIGDPAPEGVYLIQSYGGGATFNVISVA